MKFQILKPNQVSLVPDKYGKHLVVKQLTELDENGKYTKHIKIDDNTLDNIRGSFLLSIPSLWVKHQDGTYGLGGQDMERLIKKIAKFVYKLQNRKNKYENSDDGEWVIVDGKWVGSWASDE